MNNRILQFVFIFFSAVKIFATDSTLSIIFTGDVLLDRGVAKILNKNENVGKLKSISDYFKSADAAVINLEAPLNSVPTSVKKKYIFGVKEENLNIAINLGITHFSLANNHALDQSYSGLVKTCDYIQKSGKQVVGVSYTTGEFTPTLISKAGNRAAIFAFTLFKPDSDIINSNFRINYATINQIIKVIGTYKANYSNDLIILYLHWGSENTTFVSELQQKIAESFIDAGADIIIGAHSHTIQEKRIINGKPVYFSLGNFIFDSNKSPNNIGLAIKLIIKDDKISDIIENRYLIKKCLPDLAPNLK